MSATSGAGSALLANQALLVALGTVPGAWLRFRVVNHLSPLLPRRHWGTFGVNLIACFTIGLLSALDRRCGPGGSPLLLLLGTGFLGSFSTFSTFMGEVLAALRERHAGEALLLLAGSLLGGLLAVSAGLAVGS